MDLTRCMQLAYAAGFFYLFIRSQSVAADMSKCGIKRLIEMIFIRMIDKVPGRESDGRESGTT